MGLYGLSESTTRLKHRYPNIRVVEVLEELAHLELDALGWVSTTSVSLQHVSSTFTLTSASLRCSKSSPSWNLTLWGGSLQLSESTARLKHRYLLNIRVVQLLEELTQLEPDALRPQRVYNTSQHKRYLDMHVVELLEELAQL